MPKQSRINTQQMDYDIHVIINDENDEERQSCFPYCTHLYGSRLNANEMRILESLRVNKNKLFNVEYYSHKVKSTSRSSNSITIKNKLLNSIHNRLCPNESWLQGHLNNTIHKSAFTIFINNKNSSLSSSVYDPICIATISKIEVDSYTYLEVNVFCGSIDYKSCGYHQMDTIKLIAYHFKYKYIKLTSIGNPRTLKWYDTQGFLRENSDGTTEDLYTNLKDLYYEITDDDQYYSRSEIKGECKIIKTSSPQECTKPTSLSYPLMKSRKRQIKSKKNKKTLKISTI